MIKKSSTHFFIAILWFLIQILLSKDGYIRKITFSKWNGIKVFFILIVSWMKNVIENMWSRWNLYLSLFSFFTIIEEILKFKATPLVFIINYNRFYTRRTNGIIFALFTSLVNEKLKSFKMSFCSKASELAF